MRTKEQIDGIIAALEAEYPDAECTLEERDPWKLLVQVRLAAQCTDERVNKVTPALFARYPDCRAMAERLIEGFLTGDYGEVTLIGTTFVSAMTQDAQVTELLPVTPDELGDAPKPRTQMLMEPAPAALLRAVMPDYLAGCLYGAVCDAVACEMASRRNAMDSATKNAEQMINDLSLSYNRARQGSITQEITEIVAGAEQ